MGPRKFEIVFLCTTFLLLSFIPAALAQRPFVEVDTFANSECEVELMLPDQSTEVIWMTGRSVMRVNFDGEQEGSADDDDRDGRDEVQSEMVELDLTGLSPTLGPVRVGLNVGFRSAGEMEETVNNTPGVLDIRPFRPDGTVDSFFDVFFEIDVSGGTQHNEVPGRLSSVITRKPPAPSDRYQLLEPVALFDAKGGPTGYLLSAIRYRPNPPVEVDVSPNSTMELELQLPAGSTEIVWMAGPSTSRVFFEGAVEGSAFDDDGDGRDEVPTEMVQLSLSGLSPALGPVGIGLSTSLPSLGQMEEAVNNTAGVLDVPPFTGSGTVDSFFDVYVEIDVGGQKQYTQNPMRLRSRITHKPPAATDAYESLESLVLVDESGRPTGWSINAARYRPNPPVEVDVFANSVMDLTLLFPDGGTFAVWIAGQSTSRVFFEGAVEGSANDDDGDGLEEVGTEMVQLDLAGVDPTLGPVVMTLSPGFPSLGQMEEVANNTPNVLDVRPFTSQGTVDSFFDVYVEIDVGGQNLHTARPLRLGSRISHKPPGPGERYEILEPVELFNEFGEPTGSFINAGRYRPSSVVEIDVFPNSAYVIGLMGPAGESEIILMSGSSANRVFFEGAVEGSAFDDNGNGRDDVRTEMTEFNLTGVSATLGPVAISLNAGLPSPGLIEETLNTTVGILDVPPFGLPGQTADSFFDVFVEIQIGSDTLHNEIPIRLQSRISHKPPARNELYASFAPVPLVDAQGSPSGYSFGGTRYWPTALVEVDMFDDSHYQLEWISPDGGTEFLQMRGPSEMLVFFEGAVEGSAVDDDGDGLDEVSTQMVRMDLTGVSPSLGPMTLGLSASRPSSGQMEDTVNSTAGTLDVPPFTVGGTVDSFFDIYVEIDVAGYKLHTESPLRLASRITHKPPARGDVYESRTPVALLDEQGNPIGYSLGTTRYRPVSLVEVDVFPHSLCDIDLRLPGGMTQSVWMTGQSQSQVFFEGAVEGSAIDDDGDALDDVSTELIQMDFHGLSPMLGPIRLSLNPSLPSMGLMEEEVNNTPSLLDVAPFATGGMVDSFFDVFFEIEVSGQTLITVQPQRLSSVIAHKPPGPGAVYEGLTDIEFYNQQGGRTGLYVTRTRYRPSSVVEVDEFTYSQTQFELLTPGGPEVVPVTGTTTVLVFFEGAVEGSANDDDGDGRDDVRTEMIQLNLSGTSTTLGPVLLRLSTAIPSFGAIEERINNVADVLDLPPFVPYGTADSFFDIFVEIEVVGQILHTNQPKRLSSIIGHKPPGPGELFEGREDVPLFDEDNNQTGYSLGDIFYEPSVRPPGCGDAEHPYPIGDLNFDCVVDDLDLIILHHHWQECTKPECDQLKPSRER